MDIKILGVVGFLLVFTLVVVLVTVTSKRAPAAGQDAAKAPGTKPSKPAPAAHLKGGQAGRKAG